MQVNDPHSEGAGAYRAGYSNFCADQLVSVAILIVEMTASSSFCWET